MNSRNYINPNYKLSDGGLYFSSNALPPRPLIRSNKTDGAWIVAYKEDTKRHFEAVVSTQRYHQNEMYELEEKQKLPERRFTGNKNYIKTETQPGVNIIDGFYLMQLCCIEDPSDVSTLNLNGKDLNQIKEDDMVLFDNVVEIYASENNLHFDGFKTFPNLKVLSLSCNNMKTLHLKHEDFNNLESLDLSYNHLNSHDISHLGILQNIKILKLSGNNLKYLPDTFSKSYVSTNEKNEKIVSEKFPKLEELHLDNNNLTQENSFDVLAILKKLQKLYLNNNQICSIPYLKVVGHDHVLQEFPKTHYKNKNNEQRKSIVDENNKLLVDTNIKMPTDVEFHKPNVLKNSFILEEDEETEIENNLSHNNEISNDNNKSINEQNNSNQILLNGSSEHDKLISLPFSELKFIDLSNNKIEEEDNLIAIASWPMLNEVILYGNPIISKNVGYTPLIKKFLIDRLGIIIHRNKPLKPVKAPVAVQVKEHRVVNSVVTKVPKVPIEMRMMLTYPDGYEQFEKLSQRESENVNDVATKDATYKSSNSTKKSTTNDYNSFFMTQTDNDYQNENNNNENENEEEESNEKIREEKQLSNLINGYEILYDIENEDKIKIPKDMGSCVRALRNILDHPLVFRDTCQELDKPQKPYESKPRKKIMPDPPKLKSRVHEINKIVDEIRERNIIEEKQLKSALNSKNKKDQKLAKKLLNEVQEKYNEVRYESLKQADFSKQDVNNALNDLQSIRINSLNIKK